MGQGGLLVDRRLPAMGQPSTPALNLLHLTTEVVAISTTTNRRVSRFTPLRRIKTPTAILEQTKVTSAVNRMELNCNNQIIRISPNAVETKSSVHQAALLRVKTES